PLLLVETVEVRVCGPSVGPALRAVAQAVDGTRAGPLNTVQSAALPKLGASLTFVTLMSKVWLAEVSTPPFAVPPLSEIEIVTVAVPKAFAASVYVSTPVEETAGCTLNRALLLFEVLKLSVWPASSAGPA